MKNITRMILVIACVFVSGCAHPPKVQQKLLVEFSADDVGAFANPNRQQHVAAKIPGKVSLELTVNY